MAYDDKNGSPDSSTFGNGAEHSEKRASVGGYGISADAVPRDKLNAMFENPLGGIPREQLFAEVDKFCADNNLVKYNEVFRKGALVAQNPQGAKDLDILSDEEKRVLEEEHTHKWRHPKQLYYLAIMCSLCAAVQGMDETANNGAQTFYLAVCLLAVSTLGAVNVRLLPAPVNDLTVLPWAHRQPVFS